MPRPFPNLVRLRFRDKLALWFGLVVLVSTLLATWLSYVNGVNQLIDEFGTSLKIIADGAAASLDTKAFESLHDRAQMSSKEYAKVRRQLISTREAAEEAGIKLHYLYTMVPTANPRKWEYIVDTQEPLKDGKPNPEFSELGSIDEVRDNDVIQQAYQTGHSRADPDVVDYPIWGPLLSVAVPIRDKTNQRIVGIVGADAPATAVSALRDEMQRTAFVCVCIALIIVLAGSELVAIQVTRPIDALVTATEHVADGDLKYEVQINSRDELGTLGDAFNKMVAGLRLRDLYKYQFGRYVSRQIADAIMADPERDFWQGERRKATILFSDIRGFTTMSSKLPPEEVVQRLNEYLSVMVDIVFAYEGTLDKFIGDALMAVYGAPVSLGNDEERAVRSAIEMQAAAHRLEREWAERGQVGFKIGVGIDTGDVVVGNIGSDQRLEYAAIGDHVNVASRLEGLNKEYGTGILVSEETYRHVEHLVEARWVDKVAVRGREEKIDVYEIFGLKDGVGPMGPSVPQDR